MRLIFEENFSMRQAAAKVGCSLNSIKDWKAKHKQSMKSGASFPKRMQNLKGELWL